jgi:hypothetical protein
MLIPNNLVTKIIGAKGCMIKEIASKSGGAQIKILSDKYSEKDLNEIVVSVAGSERSRKEACCLITEKAELFKHGGPVS